MRLLPNLLTHGASDPREVSLTMWAEKQHLTKGSGNELLTGGFLLVRGEDRINFKKKKSLNASKDPRG